MNKILSTLLAASLLLSFACNDDDQAEPSVKVKFTIDASTSCDYSNESNPDESIAIVRVYKNINDWEDEAAPIFSGSPNANGVIDLGVISDGTFYYDLIYKGESNWDVNPLKGEGPNSIFVWNRNLSLPLEVSTKLHYGRDSVWGKYILKDVIVSGVSEYPDSCKTNDNFIQFHKDMTVDLSQRGNSTLCNLSAPVRVEELVISNLDCGDIGKTDIAHQAGDNILGIIATDKETLEVRDGKWVYRRFNETFFRDWVMVYEKQ